MQSTSTRIFFLPCLQSREGLLASRSLYRETNCPYIDEALIAPAIKYFRLMPRVDSLHGTAPDNWHIDEA
jgi:hypothetical protein